MVGTGEARISESVNIAIRTIGLQMEDFTNSRIELVICNVTPILDLSAHNGRTNLAACTSTINKNVGRIHRIIISRY